MFVPFLDRWLFRHAFEGASARRYARDERPAFGDLDERLIERLAVELATARTVLDLGCGPATFSHAVYARFPSLQVYAVDPSRDVGRWPGLATIRAAGEALPFADRAFDVAMCLSSIRHVADRAVTLRELRRVVRGTLVIVELDPTSDRRRIANHADALGSVMLRKMFGPLVCKTAPPVEMIAAIARDAGWHVAAIDRDPVQPVYIVTLD